MGFQAKIRCPKPRATWKLQGTVHFPAFSSFERPLHLLVWGPFFKSLCSPLVSHLL